MLACNRLRIDSGNGSPIVEFRIEKDRVESRDISFEAGGATEAEWRRLTSEEISSHVIAETVLARWLRRRMGLYRLLRACGADPLSQREEGPEDRLAA